MLRTQPGFACFRLRVTATNAKAVGCADEKGRQAHSRPLSFSPAVAFKRQNAAASSKGRAWAFRVHASHDLYCATVPSLCRFSLNTKNHGHCHPVERENASITLFSAKVAYGQQPAFALPMNMLRCSLTTERKHPSFSFCVQRRHSPEWWPVARKRSRGRPARDSLTKASPKKRNMP